MDSRLRRSQCTLPAQQNSKSVRPTDGVPSADLAIRPGPTSPNNRFAGSGPMRGLHCNLRPGGLRFGNARTLSETASACQFRWPSTADVAIIG